MTVSKYLNKSKEEPDFFTVQELKDKLEELIVEGKGNYVVMMPTTSSECYDWADNIFINKKDSFSTLSTCNAVYLEALSPEEDRIVANAINGID